MVVGGAFAVAGVADAHVGGGDEHLGERVDVRMEAGTEAECADLIEKDFVSVRQIVVESELVGGARVIVLGVVVDAP